MPEYLSIAIDDFLLQSYTGTCTLVGKLSVSFHLELEDKMVTLFASASAK